MKRAELVNIIKKRYAKIDKAVKCVAADFALDDIHRFRLKVKKLKSFLALVAAVKRKGVHLKLPGRLHEFYNAVGIIRGLQLQQASIKKFPHEGFEPLVKSYQDFVSICIDQEISRARKLLKGNRTFTIRTRTLRERLPKKLAPASTRKFARHQMETLTTLMHPASLSDASLHAVRKLLKDVLYTWSYANLNYKHPHQVPLSQEEIISIVKTLGDFQDKCAGLDLLHIHYKEQQGGARERIMWRKLENLWWKEKEVNRATIHKLFHKGSLLPARAEQSLLPLPLKQLSI